MKENCKVLFRLAQDEFGYPPATEESVWAIPVENGNYRIDNIPFFVRGISSDDEVAVKKTAEGFFFRELVKPSGNSTFRLFLFQPESVEKIRDDLRELGCVAEFHKRIGLLAVEIPANVAIEPFLEYIVTAQGSGELEIEEGALRHAIAAE